MNRKIMNSQKFSKIMISLQSLGIVGLIFFTLAFACDDDNPPKSSPNTNGQTPIVKSEGCSTQEEFLRIFKRDRLKTATTRDELQNPEIIVTSFNVATPTTYSAVYNNKVLDIYPVYPVTVGWTSRTFRSNKIEEGDFEEDLYYCYKNPEDYTNKFIPEDDRFPKNACVCIQQGGKGMTATKWRECQYDENDPYKTCSAN